MLFKLHKKNYTCYLTLLTVLRNVYLINYIYLGMFHTENKYILNFKSKKFSQYIKCSVLDVINIMLSNIYI